MIPALPTVLDFETEAIQHRPYYPPEPVGCAIAEPGKRAKYLAWGHPSANNVSKRDAYREIKGHFRGRRPLLFFNAKFDVDIAETHLGVRPQWDRIHCAMIMAFLMYPNRLRLGLKEVSEDILGVPPDEQDALRAWIVEHFSDVTKRTRDWGKYIGQCPGTVVSPYAIGDVTRPRDLWKKWAPTIFGELREPYEREMRLMPILLESERAGFPIATNLLERDVKRWEKDLDGLDAYLRKYLGASPDLDLDKNDPLADALEDAGVVSEWILTPKSEERSLKWQNLVEVVNDPYVLGMLRHRARLTNSLRNFGRPWLERTASDGLLHMNWNQVKGGDEKGNRFGARTGRLSSNPNVQNIPRAPDPIVSTKREYDRMLKAGDDPTLLPAMIAERLSPSPNMRSYVVPLSRSDTLFDRDYNQHELRILAHYEGQALLEAYNENPRTDMHEYAREMTNRILGTNFPRKPIKNVGFGILYGSGIDRTAEQTKQPPQTVKLMRKTYVDEVAPGIGELQKELKARARADEPIWTWGGRRYYVEESRVIDGRLRDYAYKLLNTLIQGSAGDCLKEAWIRYESVRKDARLYLTVHDEYLGSAPKGAMPREMKLLKEAMESCIFDVPLLTDGTTSSKNWASMKGYKDR